MDREAQPDCKCSPCFSNRATWSSIGDFKADLAPRRVAAGHREICGSGNWATRRSERWILHCVSICFVSVCFQGIIEDKLELGDRRDGVEVLALISARDKNGKSRRSGKESATSHSPRTFQTPRYRSYTPPLWPVPPPRYHAMRQDPHDGRSPRVHWCQSHRKKCVVASA